MFEIVFLLRTSVFTFLQKNFPCVYVKSYLFKKIDFPPHKAVCGISLHFFSASCENKFALTGDFRLVIHHRALPCVLFFVRLTLLCFFLHVSSPKVTVGGVVVVHSKTQFVHQLPIKKPSSLEETTPRRQTTSKSYMK